MLRLGRNTSHFRFVEYAAHSEVCRLTPGYTDVKSSLRISLCGEISTKRNLPRMTLISLRKGQTKLTALR